VTRAVEPQQPEKSLGDLRSGLTEVVSTLVRKEFELAREEIRAEASKAGRAATMLGAAGATAFFAVLMLLFAAAWGLDARLPTGVAFLIVGAVLAVGAAVLGLQGKQRMKQLNPAPEQTIQTLKEDAQWLKEQRS
jgi:hypothetical protein